MCEQFKYNVGDMVHLKMAFAGEPTDGLPGFSGKITSRRIVKCRPQYCLEGLRGWFPEDVIYCTVKEAKAKRKLRRVSFYANLSDAEVETLERVIVHMLSEELRIQDCTKISIQEIQ